jgi:hypothetical protein
VNKFAVGPVDPAPDAGAAVLDLGTGSGTTGADGVLLGPDGGTGPPAYAGDTTPTTSATDSKPDTTRLRRKESKGLQRNKRRDATQQR